MEKTGCEIICGATTTLAIKGQMLLLMNYSEPFDTIVECKSPHEVIQTWRVSKFYFDQGSESLNQNIYDIK